MFQLPDPQKREVGSEPFLWVWNGAPQYKNDRLLYYQHQLISLGITNREHLKWYAAQLIQENGSFDESGIYHGGCVFGIPQINTCGRFHISASRYLEKHPEWKAWDFQLSEMAKQTLERSKRFNGELSCTIVAHFHPYGANGAQGLYKRNGNCKTHKYWYSHVSPRLALLVQS